MTVTDVAAAAFFHADLRVCRADSPKRRASRPAKPDATSARERGLANPTA